MYKCIYGRCTSTRGTSRNHGMTEKKRPFINSQKVSNEISSVTKTIKFARHVINSQLCDVTNDVIIFEHDSRHFTNVRKLTMATGSLNLSSHEKLKACFGKN